MNGKCLSSPFLLLFLLLFSQALFASPSSSFFLEQRKPLFRELIIIFRNICFHKRETKCCAKKQEGKRLRLSKPLHRLRLQFAAQFLKFLTKLYTGFFCLWSICSGSERKKRFCVSELLFYRSDHVYCGTNMWIRWRRVAEVTTLETTQITDNQCIRNEQEPQ